MSEANERRAHVETLRGIASLIVVAHHLVLALRQEAILSLDPAVSWARSPLFVFVSGGAAVAFFFVLSGDVLATPLLASGDRRALLRGAVKRWPRLAGPVVVVVLASWALFATGGYRFEDAAEIIESGWLQTFATAIPHDTTPSLTFADAVAEGTWRTFLFGDYAFDSSLWTMQWEFFGSFGVFAVVGALSLLRRQRVAQAVVVLAVIVIVGVYSPLAASFGVGVLLAWWRSVRAFVVGNGAAVVCVVVGCVCLGYEHSFGFYAAVPVLDPAIPRTLGSVLLITASEGCAPLQRALSGAAGRWLGRLSFPLYLVHVPVFCSAGAAVLLVLAPVVGVVGAKVGFVVASIIASIAAAVALSGFERRWLQLVRRFGLRAVPPISSSR